MNFTPNPNNSVFRCQKCGSNQVILGLIFRLECWPHNRADATPVMRLNQDMLNSAVKPEATIECQNENCGYVGSFIFDGRLVLEDQ